MEFDVDVRIDVDESIACRFEFWTADVARSMQKLPLQVGDVDIVKVDETQLPDARRGEVQRYRRPEPASADDEYARRFQPTLSDRGHVRQQQVSAVAANLFR